MTWRQCSQLNVRRWQTDRLTDSIACFCLFWYPGKQIDEMYNVPTVLTCCSAWYSSSNSMLRSSRLWFSRSIRSSSAILTCRYFDNSASLGMLLQLVWHGYLQHLQQAALQSHESCSKHGEGKGYSLFLDNEFETEWNANVNESTETANL